MATSTAPTEYVLPDVAIPPGELLAEELEERGLTQKQLADVMGRPAQAINEIIHGRKAITAETALQLNAALGIDARHWLNLESDYRLILANQKPDTQTNARRIAERAAAYETKPGRKRHKG
jgi:HTH-type transcriptional regulator/antitoxin HigA